MFHIHGNLFVAVRFQFMHQSLGKFCEVGEVLCGGDLVEAEKDALSVVRSITPQHLLPVSQQLGQFLVRVGNLHGGSESVKVSFTLGVERMLSSEITGKSSDVGLRECNPGSHNKPTWRKLKVPPLATIR